MTRRDLEKYASVMTWFKSIRENNPEGKLTERARDSRIGTMREFLEFLGYGPDGGMSPDDLLVEARTNLDATKGRLMDYFNWLKGERVQGYAKRKVGMQHNSALTYLAFMRGFFSHNSLGFGKWRMPKRQVPGVSAADEATPIYDDAEAAEKSVLRTERLQHFFANLGFRDQTIALGMLSTGADAADLFNLNVGFVRGQKDERRLFWHGNREKDVEPFKTFFSEEATRFMRQFAEQERRKARPKDPLFVNSWGRRLNVHALDMTFRVAAKRMGYDNDNGNPFRPKRFRHLFRTACSMAGIDPGFVNCFMGHKTDISGGYLEKSRGLLLKEYVKAERFVLVFGKSSETTRLAEKTDALEGLIDERGRRLKALEAEVRALRSELKGVHDAIGEFVLEPKTARERAQRFAVSMVKLIKEVVEKSGGPSLSDADVIAYLTHGDLDRILKGK